MNMPNQMLLFFFSALGAFNSSLLSIYFFFFAKPKHISNSFLGGLLAALSIRIWKSLFYYFNPELSKVFLQIGLSACFFIGPFLYLYTQSKLNEDKGQRKAWFVHLLVLLIVIVGVGLYYPYKSNPLIWRNYIVGAINYVWLGYILLTAYVMTPLFQKLWTSKNKVSFADFWILSVFFSVLIVWLAYFTTYYTSYIVGALSFSTVLYLSIVSIYFQYKKKEKGKKEKYANNKVSSSEANNLLAKVDALIMEKELYRNPNLSLPKLASEMKISSHFLSQILNDNRNKNFSQFINEYRINEAIKQLKLDNPLKIEIIAEQCGFNSNSTFYSAFKKITNTTPAKYIAENQR